MANPDLQSILQDLARYSTPTQSTSNHTVETDNTSSTLPGLATTASQPELQPEKPHDPRLRPQQSRPTSTPSPKPIIDPATITTWQEGIRCVTKIAAQNAQFANSIRKMIETQRKAELRWYTERQELKHLQARRSSSSAQAKSILSSLSFSPANDTSETEKADAGREGLGLEAELAAFDLRIYEAQRAMEEGVLRELKGLGVPFFGTEEGLVVSDEDGGARGGEGASSRPKWSPLVTEGELLELRRRMVGHLEDLYKD